MGEMADDAHDIMEKHMSVFGDDQAWPELDALDPPSEGHLTPGEMDDWLNGRGQGAFSDALNDGRITFV